jgi:hypothetical protein
MRSSAQFLKQYVGKLELLSRSNGTGSAADLRKKCDEAMRERSHGDLAEAR